MILFKKSLLKISKKGPKPTIMSSQFVIFFRSNTTMGDAELVDRILRRQRIVKQIIVKTINNFDNEQIKFNEDLKILLDNKYSTSPDISHSKAFKSLQHATEVFNQLVLIDLKANSISDTKLSKEAKSGATGAFHVMCLTIASLPFSLKDGVEVYLQLHRMQLIFFRDPMGHTQKVLDFLIGNQYGMKGGKLET